MDDFPGGIVEIEVPTVEVQHKTSYNTSSASSTTTTEPTRTLPEDREKASLVVLSLLFECGDGLEKTLEHFAADKKYDLSNDIREIMKRLADVAKLAGLPYRSHKAISEALQEVMPYDYSQYRGWHGHGGWG